MAEKHISIETWLSALGLGDYIHLFSKYGGVEDLIYMRESDVRDLGLKNSSHRAKIISSLRILREKYEKGSRRSGVELHRSSSASAELSSSTSLNRPDFQMVNASPEKLDYDLQRELQGDPSELKSHAWYHGSVSRQRAEQLVHSNGDYLVRDCISQPGDFVLSCCCRGVPLHFMVNSKVTDMGYNAIPKITYHFEEGEFMTIQDLIRHYLVTKKAVTKTSGAVIVNPVARVMPLSYYDTKYGTLSSLSSFESLTPDSSPRPSPYNTPSGSPKVERHKKNRTGSQPLLSFDDDEGRSSPQLDRCDSLPTIQGIGTRHTTENHYQPTNVIQHKRSGSEPVLVPVTNVLKLERRASPFQGLSSAESDSTLNKPPPPKPSRIPSVKYKQRPLVPIRKPELFTEDDGRDYSDYMQVKEEPSWLKTSPSHEVSRDFNRNITNFQSKMAPDNTTVMHNVPVTPTRHGLQTYSKQTLPDSKWTSLESKQTSPDAKQSSSGSQFRQRFPSDTRFSILDSIDYDVIYSPKEKAMDDKNIDYDIIPNRNYNVVIPEVKEFMSYDLPNFTSLLLPEENRPLEASTLISLKATLFNCDIKHLSQHLTKVDLDLLRIIGDPDLGVFVHSGLELVTLPQGKELRQNIVERCYCMKAFVMATILTCHNMTERAHMISQWVQMAAELRSAMGNLFAFVMIMEGLTSPQIHRLHDTWFVLRQNHTSSAFLFDTKLKAAFKHLNDGSSSLPLQNVSIPNIVPVVQLLETDVMSVMDYCPWELTDPIFGLDVVLTHLDTARLITAQCGLYSLMAESVVKNLKLDQDILDIFSTEMHLKLLWGSKGSKVNRKDRHSKFDKLLTILSEKAERPGDDGTAV